MLEPSASKDPDALHVGLARVLATDGPVLVDVVTNPDEVALPPHTTAHDAWGFAIAKFKEAVRSRGDT